MSEVTHPEPDRIEGAPHPRETVRLLGQDRAEAAFLDAFNSGRLHHGWLLTGPRGVGKATLAWRIARFLLSRPASGDAGLFGDDEALPSTLDVAPEHPVARRIAALSEPGLKLIRRGLNDKGQLQTVITVSEIRRLNQFFGLSATDGGRRVVIVDSADEMNPNASNALLKLLEEPPARATLLLVSHRPSALLPTIRSRCRELRLDPLEPGPMAEALRAAGITSGPNDPGAGAAGLAELSAGSVGEAIRLARLDGLKTYQDLVDLFSGVSGLDRSRAVAFAETLAGRNTAARFDLCLRLLDVFLARLARGGVMGPPQPEAATGESALIARLSPGPAAGRHWAELAQTLGARGRHGQAVNLDPAALVLDMVLKIDASARETAA